MVGAAKVDNLDIYYKTLGVRPGTSLQQVKHAYRDLVKVWHPDRFSHDPRLQHKANEQLKAINDAYKVLYKELTSINVRYHGLGQTGDTSTPPKKPRKTGNRYPSYPREETSGREKSNPSAKQRKSTPLSELGWKLCLAIVLAVMMALLWLLVLRFRALYGIIGRHVATMALLWFLVLR